MECLNSDICTGVKGIEFFDLCALKYPSFDIPILKEIANTVGLGKLIASDWNTFRDFWECNLELSRSDENMSEFQFQIELLGATLANMFAADASNKIASFRIWVMQALVRVSSQLSYSKLDIRHDFFSIATSRLKNVVWSLSNSSSFSEAKEAARAKMEPRLSYDYLILVATEIEQKSVFEKARKIGNDIVPHYGGGRAYYDLGVIHGNRIALVKVAMGSSDSRWFYFYHDASSSAPKA